MNRPLTAVGVPEVRGKEGEIRQVGSSEFSRPQYCLPFRYCSGERLGRCIAELWYMNVEKQPAF